jgi:hypothetical protein
MLLQEAQMVAAAAAPELLAVIPEPHRAEWLHSAADRVVQTMLAHGHVEPAIDSLFKNGDPSSFPFSSVEPVLQRLDDDTPASAGRRLALLRHALELWRTGAPSHHRDQFLRLFGRRWMEFPAAEAAAIARIAADRAESEPDAKISARYIEVEFRSNRQHRPVPDSACPSPARTRNRPIVD